MNHPAGGCNGARRPCRGHAAGTCANLPSGSLHARPGCCLKPRIIERGREHSCPAPPAAARVRLPWPLSRPEAGPSTRREQHEWPSHGALLHPPRACKDLARSRKGQTGDLGAVVSWAAWGSSPKSLLGTFMSLLPLVGKGSLRAGRKRGSCSLFINRFSALLQKHPDSPPPQAFFHRLQLCASQPGSLETLSRVPWGACHARCQHDSRDKPRECKQE